MSNYPPYFSCFVVLTMGFTLAKFGGNLAPVGAFVGAVIDGLVGTDNGQMAMSLVVEQFADPRTLWGPNNDIAPVRYFADYFVWEPFLEPAE